MELGVPVAATGGGLVVTGEPAWLPAPPRISPPAAPRGPDRVAQSQLMNELPAFFQAYASGDKAALNRFRFRGVSVTGLGGAVTFDSVSALRVPPGGASRQITVTVIWQLPANSQDRDGKSRDGLETRDDIWYVGCRPSKRQMVCKRDWSVNRGGGSPMTTTRPANVAMPARGHVSAAGRSWPGLASVNWSPSRTGLRLARLRRADPRPGCLSPVGLLQTCLRPLPRRSPGSSRPGRCRTRAPSGRQVRRVPGRTRSHIRFTCTCPSGLPQHYLDVQLIPEGTCYAYSPRRRDGSSGVEYAGPRHLPAGSVRAIVPRYRRIVAIFFLFPREITRFVQVIVLAVAIAVISYTPGIVQTLVGLTRAFYCRDDSGLSHPVRLAY